MSIPAPVIEKWERLNEADRRQTAAFIDFLLQKRANSDKSSNISDKHITLGVWKDEPLYITADFDECYRACVHE
ncbi:MAG: hypothetical protein IJJ23_12410 [Clostridia bacterium]|nr:hypothetical protein [Clostridia bacterium]